MEVATTAAGLKQENDNERNDGEIKGKGDIKARFGTGKRYLLNMPGGADEHISLET
jgi:hypothetical protein